MNGFQISVDASEVVALADAWQNAPDIAIEEMSRAVLEGELLLERETKERTPVGVHGEAGGLKGSITAQEPKVLADQVLGVIGSPLLYAVPVELGTRPHFPPIQPLADWAHYKLGVPVDQAEHVGFLIARKISIAGTKGAFMFTRAFEQNESQVQGFFQAAAARIVSRMINGASA